MELTRATLELLRDEAYVFFASNQLREKISADVRDKTSAVRSRSPFDRLPASSRLESGANVHVGPTDNEVPLVERLQRLSRFEHWIQRCIRIDLVAYLEEASPEYQRLGRIQKLLNEWEFCVRRLLPETLTAFARNLQELRQAMTAADVPTTLTASARVALRETAARLEEQDHQRSQIAAAIAGHAHGIHQTELRVPTLPHFRRTLWVDWLAVISREDVMSELTRVEAEVRAFVDKGVPTVVTRVQGSREYCNKLQETFLQNYWNQLRAQAQAHYCEQRKTDELLATLGRRYDPEIAQRHRGRTVDSFSCEFPVSIPAGHDRSGK